MAKIIKPKEPRKLKKLEPSDLLTMEGSNEDIFLVTKQETAAIVREFIRNEIENVGDEFIETERKELDIRLGIKLREMEKSASAFIEHRINLLSEKICDMLIQRKFNEEVNRKVEEILKKKKGSF